MNSRNTVFTPEDVQMMRYALAEAAAAAADGEIPVGAVLCRGGRVIAAAHNRREGKKDITAHAEVEVLREAGGQLGDWRLSDCTLYVTLEPCPMCAGAILGARVGRVVYGARDAAAGALGSVLNLPRFPLGAHPTVTGGLLEEECRTVLQDFFRARREAKNNKENT